MEIRECMLILCPFLLVLRVPKVPARFLRRYQNPDRHALNTQRLRSSFFNDNHSQCHVAERRSVACPMVQLIADPIEVESEHVGALAKVDPELVDGQELAVAKRTDMRAGKALLMLHRPEWISLAHELFGVGQQAGLDGPLLAAHPRKGV